MFCYKIIKSKKRPKLVFSGQNGFTFLEIIISLAVLSLGALATLETINVSMRLNYQATQEVIATNLAQALMSEILAKKFANTVGDTNIGIETIDGETGGRFAAPPSNYDDVDDFNGTLDGPPPVSMKNFPMNGVAVAQNYPGFTRSVRVEWYNTTTSAVDTNPTSCKQVTVTVNGPGVSNSVTWLGYKSAL